MRILTFKVSKEGSLVQEFFEDSIDAFRSLGQDVYVCDLYRMREDLGNSQDLAKVVYEEVKLHKPNFIFTITYFGLLPRLFDELKIPYVAWVTDDPITNELPPPSPYFHLFIHEKGAVDEVKGLGYENLYHLPLAANPKRYSQIPKDKKRFRWEVSFLGNAGPIWEDGYSCHEELYPLLSKEMITKMIDSLRNDPLQDILKVFFEVKTGASNKDASRFAKELEERHPAKAYQIKGWLKPLKSEAMKWRRRDIIKEIADHIEIHLYGDTCWGYLVGNSKAVYHGKVWDIDAIVGIYNGSKINMNVQSNIYNTGLNYRTFTIPASGGFMISDYRDELLELFCEEEVVYFKERCELVELINYYLKAPNEREKIAKRARERVLREHTYKERMKRVLDVMKWVV